MKVLYFYQYFTTPKGAWGTRAYEFARRWVQAGDSVTVITCVFDRSDVRPDRWISRFQIDGIDVRVLNVRVSNKHGFPRRLLSFAAYALCACWYALFAPADVVLASSGPLTVSIPGLVSRYVRRRPLVFEVRDLWPEGAIQLGVVRNRLLILLARLLEKMCYRAATRVVALSEGMAAWIRDRYGIQHLEVVPNAADNQLMTSLPDDLTLPSWTREKQLVIYTGTLGLMDDCGQILDMARVQQQSGASQIEVVFIGDGQERAALEDRARQLGLKEIHFLGKMSKEDAMRWLRRACCALVVFKNVPLLATVSPNKLFDALAAGVPVVQNTDGWIRDLLDRHQCGLSAPPGDAEALANAVLRLARDRQLANRLGANARRVAVELFDRSVLAAKMRQVLAEAAGHKRRTLPRECRPETAGHVRPLPTESTMPSSEV